jgi:hypothetical protein
VAGPGVPLSRYATLTESHTGRRMIKRIWEAVTGLVRSTPTDLDLAAQAEAEADRERSKDRWMADEARQSRQWTNIGG